MPKPTYRFRHLILLLIVVALAAAYVVHALVRPLGAITPSISPPPSIPAQTVTLPWPAYGEGALGAVGYGVLASHGSQTALPTASTIKILTALTVLKQHPLNPGDQGPAITITQADVDSYNKYVAEDGSVVRVQVGEQISEYQALQALLLPSANNMAETLARWAYGSLDAYDTAANQYATTLGMADTTVTDPSGFLPSTVSSAHDLTILGETAIQNPVLAQIVAQRYAEIPVQGTIYNVNQVLGENGVIGIKTGNNDQDTGAFLFAAQHTVGGKTLTLVGAIMGAPTLGVALHDSLPVISAADNNFSLITIAHAGDVVGTYAVPWAKPIKAVASKDLTMLTWKGNAIMTTENLQKLHAPVSTAQSVGTVTAQNSLDSTKTSVPAVLKQTLPTPGWVWRLTHP